MNANCKYYKPFTCAHTPRLGRVIPITFRLIDMKEPNGMQNVRWYYRLWIYTWVGQRCIDVNSGRIK